MTLTTEMLNYLGGLFDGEGCVMARLTNRSRRRPTHRVTVSLCMIQPDIVLFFKNKFGGSFCVRKMKQPNHRVAYQWQLSDMGAYKFLIIMRPYVRLKASQFDVAIELHERVQLSRTMYKKGKGVGRSGPRLPEEEMVRRQLLCDKLSVIKFASEPLGTLTIEANSAKGCDADAELNGFSRILNV